MIDVRITQALPHSLRGEPLRSERRVGASADPRGPPIPSRQVLAFSADADNSELANVTGALDANLRRSRPSSRWRSAAAAISSASRGRRPRRSRRSTWLPALPPATRSGRSPSTTSSCISSSGARPPAAAEQAVGEPLPTLHTRRRELHGRTPRQRDYLASMLEHDISFGIGPAGTGKTYLAVACAVDALERDASSASC